MKTARARAPALCNSSVTQVKRIIRLTPVGANEKVRSLEETGASNCVTPTFKEVCSPTKLYECEKTLTHHIATKKERVLAK
jgi:hypothetical protein